MGCRSSIRGLRSQGGRLTPASQPARARGFTLLEILAVLALFGLISAVLIGGSGALLRAVSRDDVENTALGAIASARHDAVLAGRTLDLRLDEPGRALDWGAGRAPLTGPGDVRLLPVVMDSAVLIGGQFMETPLARVRFYADGTCDPFRLEIVRNQSHQVMAIDPWTCTVLSPDAGAKH
jgi:prepilin-type N-terminal cleavage/methylation domain-containing protein